MSMAFRKSLLTAAAALSVAGALLSPQAMAGATSPPPSAPELSPRIVETAPPDTSVPGTSGPESAAPEAPPAETPGASSSEAPPASSSAAPSAEPSSPSGSASQSPKAQNKAATAAVAAGCQTYPPTTFQVCGRIRDKYNQTGGPTGFLLFPKSNELTNPGNTGKRSEFLGGNIYWSAATDAHPVAHDFLTKWGEKGYETGYLKYPTTDEIVLSDGVSRRQEYQGGSIYWAAGIGAHTIQGAIKDKWIALGAQGKLGFPTSDEMTTPDGIGRYNTFQNGSIYWSPSTGAHWLTTEMVDRWGTENYEAGPLGYPISDPAFDATAKTETQVFQGGNITISTIGRHTAEINLPDGGLSNCVFDTKTDDIHISKTKVDVSGHAWWVAVSNCPPDLTATVEAQLQTRNPDGVWADRGDPGVNDNARSGSGTGKWAAAHFTCTNLTANNTWRLEVDVDLNGVADLPNKDHSGNYDIKCGVV